MVSPEEYQERWNREVEELTRIGWYLDRDDQERLDGLKDELRELIGTATENKRREDADGIDADRINSEEYDG